MLNLLDRKYTSIFFSTEEKETNGSSCFEPTLRPSDRVGWPPQTGLSERDPWTRVKGSTRSETRI